MKDDNLILIVSVFSGIVFIVAVFFMILSRGSIG